MEELVRFRCLNDQLKDDEFAQFMSECVKSIFSTSNGRCLFSKMMFNGFQHNPEEIIPFTNITENIINSRKSKPNQEEIVCFDKLDDLPSEIILECASFLETTDYVHFGHSNRKIYKSIYLPSKIQILSRNAFRKYPQTLSMKRFKNIKNLSIDLYHFNNNLSSSNQSIWKTENKLNNLNIDECDEDDLIQFIENKQMDLTNIKSLTIYSMELETMSFVDFISNFPSIQYMDFGDVWCYDNDVNDENISNILKSIPNLKQFVYSPNCRLSPLIVTAFSDKLEALRLEYVNDCDISPSIMLPKLRELYLVSPENTSLWILDRIKHLKTAKFAIDEEDDERITEQFINKVIDEQLYLEHLKFDIDAKLFHSTISELESAIFSSRDKQRKSSHLLIEFEINKWKSEVMDKMDLSMMRLVHWMTSKELKLNEFTIKIKMKQSEEFDKNSVKMKKWLNALETMKENYFIQYGFTKNEVYEFIFSISNKTFQTKC